MSPSFLTRGCAASGCSIRSSVHREGCEKKQRVLERSRATLRLTGGSNPSPRIIVTTSRKRQRSNARGVRSCTLVTPALSCSSRDSGTATMRCGVSNTLVGHYQRSGFDPRRRNLNVGQRPNNEAFLYAYNEELPFLAGICSKDVSPFNTASSLRFNEPRDTILTSCQVIVTNHLCYRQVNGCCSAIQCCSPIMITEAL